jgi:glycosyltransferase involved in cell wall biosynthesis
MVKARGYDLIASQDHLSTAARIAWFNRHTPVVLQTHLYIDPPAKGPLAFWQNFWRRREMQSLAGITLVSEATLRQFELDWPDIDVPRTVITNAFDFRTWRTDAEKHKCIVVVGRTDETKGILEAAEGVSAFLVGATGWSARFLLSNPHVDPQYLRSVERALASVSDRAKILTGLPFAEVKDLTESAAVSIVASKWLEPFGRTALEAHAAGVALISSGTGGLREVSGDGALYLPEITGPAICQALEQLATDAELRHSLAADGADHVRKHFSLTPTSGSNGEAYTSVSEKLDNFLDQAAKMFRARKSRK